MRSTKYPLGRNSSRELDSSHHLQLKWLASSEMLCKGTQLKSLRWNYSDEIWLLWYNTDCISFRSEAKGYHKNRMSQEELLKLRQEKEPSVNGLQGISNSAFPEVSAAPSSSSPSPSPTSSTPPPTDSNNSTTSTAPAPQESPATGTGTGTKSTDHGINDHSDAAVKQQSAVEVKIVQKKPGNAKNALFVGRLHSKVTEDALRDVFRQFGRVVSVGISKSEKGPSFGFVEMEDEVTANTAYQYNQGREMYGLPIHVEKYGSKSSSKGNNINSAISNRYAIVHKNYWHEIIFIKIIDMFIILKKCALVWKD